MSSSRRHWEDVHGTLRVLQEGMWRKPLAACLAVLLSSPVPATASDWLKFDAPNGTNDIVPTGAIVSGVINDRHGKRSARLVVSCTDSRTRVFISADYLVFGGDLAWAEHTIDEEPPRRSVWEVCAGDLCAGMWGTRGIEFVRSFLDAAVLKVSFRRHFAEPIQATFQVRGAREAFGEVGPNCKWMEERPI